MIRNRSISLLIDDLESAVFNNISLDLVDGAPIPNDEVPFVDPFMVEDFLSKSNSPNELEAKLSLVNSIRHIPYNEFSKQLNASVDLFNKQLFDNPYCVIWDKKVNKSRRWVFELAKPNLKQLPVAGTYGLRADLVVPMLIRNGIFNLAFFDDGGFGGMQIQEDITQFSSVYRSLGYKSKFTIVVPYSSKLARKVWTSIPADIDFISTGYFSSVEELVSEEHLSILDSLGSKTRDSVSNFFNFPSVFFDHSKPDDKSLCHMLDPLITDSDLIKPYKTRPYADVESSAFKIFDEVKCL